MLLLNISERYPLNSKYLSLPGSYRKVSNSMQLYGLQKMTLLDYPGFVACTVFLGGCNLRCPFCHNFGLALETVDPIMTEDTFFSFLRKRRGLLEGVVISGGEPCLHRQLPVFCEKIKDLGFLVKLDTNGLYPKILAPLLSTGLVDYVAMDIKNSLSKYPLTAGLSDLDTEPITTSVSLIMQSGINYEFRTTVVEEYHTDNDFESIGELIAGATQYFIQPFTDRDSVPQKNLHAPDEASLHRYASIMKHYVAHVGIRGI